MKPNVLMDCLCFDLETIFALHVLYVHYYTNVQIGSGVVNLSVQCPLPKLKIMHIKQK